MADRYDLLGQQRRRRDLFEAMWAQSQGKPVRNVWEGLGNLGATLTYAYMANKKGEQADQEQKDSQQKYASLVGAMLGGGNKQGAITPPTPIAAPDPKPTVRPLSGGMDPMQAIGQIESGGIKEPQNATSPKGAMGQFQLMPATAAEIAKSKGDKYALDILAQDPLAFEQYVRDPAVNAEYGQYYFEQQKQALAPLAQQLGLPPEVVAAAAYNAGPGRVQEAAAAAGGDPQKWLAALPAETQAYLVGTAEKPGFVQMTGSPNGPGSNLTLPAAPQGAPAPGAAPSPAAPAPGGVSAEQVVALLNDPATFELGQQLAMAMLEKQMAGASPQMETMTLSDGSIVQRDPSNGALSVVVKGGLLSPAEMEQEIKLRQAGRATTSINNMGNIPVGWQVITDPQTGAQRMEPVPGGPVDLEQQAKAKAQDAATANKSTANDIVRQDIDRAIEAVQGQGGLGGLTGLGGQVMSWIGGTGAYDLEATLDTVKANIGFDRLQAMREASPTGGALGNVTERELAQLQAVMGNLSIGQSEDQLLRNLTRLKEVYGAIVDGTNYEAVMGFPPPAGSAAPAPQGGIIRYDAQGNRLP